MPLTTYLPSYTLVSFWGLNGIFSVWLLQHQKLQSKLCINLMTYLLRSTGPEITWYCKETREISFMCFSFALDSARVDIMVRRKHVPLQGGVCHLQEFLYPARARRITCEERTLAAGINSSSLTDLHAFTVQQLNQLQKEAGSMIHFKILVFWDHLFWYK